MSFLFHTSGSVGSLGGEPPRSTRPGIPGIPLRKDALTPEFHRNSRARPARGDRAGIMAIIKAVAPSACMN